MEYGAPERIRTSDLCLRRAALYPAELRAHSKLMIARQFRVRNLTCAGGFCPALRSKSISADGQALVRGYADQIFIGTEGRFAVLY